MMIYSIMAKNTANVHNQILTAMDNTLDALRVGTNLARENELEIANDLIAIRTAIFAIYKKMGE